MNYKRPWFYSKLFFWVANNTIEKKTDGAGNYKKNANHPIHFITDCNGKLCQFRVGSMHDQIPINN